MSSSDSAIQSSGQRNSVSIASSKTQQNGANLFRRSTSKMTSTPSDSKATQDVSNDDDSAISLKGEPIDAESSSHAHTSSIVSPSAAIFPHTQISEDHTTQEQVQQDHENQQAIHQAEAQIVPDTFSGDDAFDDDGYDSDSLQSASTSLTSSARNFAFENGRRYHKFREGAYNFPNDDTEQDREDMKHAMVMNLCQQLHFAPIGDNPQRILDMGTGTGIWAIESECCTRGLDAQLT